MPLTRSIKLSNGVEMPQFGLGVWQAKEGDEAYNAVKHALAAGYRHVDTAAIYGNEKSVGKAIRDSGIPRDQIFITTKLWNSDQGYNSALKACERSLSLLGVDYLDLYLIHWPGKDKYIETWKAFEHLYAQKKVRAIGLSNFHIHHIDNLLKEATVKPMVNQIELHPLLTQVELREHCNKHNIAVTAWSPLGQGHLLEDPTVSAIAAKHNRTPAQIILRWDIQHGLITIPKSSHRERIVMNSKVFDFELPAEDMATIDGMNQNKRFGPDPEHFFGL